MVVEHFTRSPLLCLTCPQNSVKIRKVMVNVDSIVAPSTQRPADELGALRKTKENHNIWEIQRQWEHIYDHRWNSVSGGGGKCGVIIKRLSRGIKPGTGGAGVAETDQKTLWSIHTACQTNNMLSSGRSSPASKKGLKLL